MNAIGLFFIFLFTFVVGSVAGFFIVKQIHPDMWENHLTHESVGISGSILDVLAIFVSIPLSLILIFLWGEYNKLLNRVNHVVDQLKQIKQQLVILNMDDKHFNKYIKTGCVDHFNQFKLNLYKHGVNNGANATALGLLKKVDQLDVCFDFKQQV